MIATAALDNPDINNRRFWVPVVDRPASLAGVSGLSLVQNVQYQLPRRVKIFEQIFRDAGELTLLPFRHLLNTGPLLIVQPLLIVDFKKFQELRDQPFEEIVGLAVEEPSCPLRIRAVISLPSYIDSSIKARKLPHLVIDYSP